MNITTAARMALDALESDPVPLNAINNACAFLRSALAAPPAAPAVPLTDADIDRIADRLWEQGHIQSLSKGTARIFARAIEKAHGIGGGICPHEDAVNDWRLGGGK